MTYFEDLDRVLRIHGIKICEDLPDGSTITRRPPNCGKCLEPRNIISFTPPNDIGCVCMGCGKEISIPRWLLIVVRKDKNGNTPSINGSMVGGAPGEHGEQKLADKPLP